jgi:hypothetical protein
MDDWDPTDRVVVIVHETGLGTVGDDGPTVTTPPREEPPMLNDQTERHRCEFEEDTAVEFDWANAPN